MIPRSLQDDTLGKWRNLREVGLRGRSFDPEGLCQLPFSLLSMVHDINRFAQLSHSAEMCYLTADPSDGERKVPRSRTVPSKMLI